MKKILVTGGAGFIGSHLCEELLRQGKTWFVWTIISPGSKDNILHLRENPHFEIIRHDLVNPIVLEVDRIYNLACPASPIHYQFNPVKTVKTNVMGTLNMLGLAKRVRARLLQASTSEVYGDPAVHPQTGGLPGECELYRPPGLLRRGEAGGRDADDGLPSSAPGGHPDRAHLQHLRSAHGPGRRQGGEQFHHPGPEGGTVDRLRRRGQTRSFCYISDLVRGLMAMMDQEPFTGPVNLGNPTEFTILIPGREGQGHDGFGSRRLSLSRSRKTTLFKGNPISAWPGKN